MSSSKSRDIQILTYILKNQNNIRAAIKRMGVSLNQSATNSIVKDDMAFDLCAMYMAQIGENVKLLTEESQTAVSQIIDVPTLKYFRNMIDHDYEKVNKTILRPYIESAQSDKAMTAIKKLISNCSDAIKADTTT